MGYYNGAVCGGLAHGVGEGKVGGGQIEGIARRMWSKSGIRTNVPAAALLYLIIMRCLSVRLEIFGFPILYKTN